MLIKKTKIIILICLVAYSHLTACRIWSSVLKEGSSFSQLDQESKSSVLDELSHFYQASSFHANGWGLIAYGQNISEPAFVLDRSIYPATEDSSRYWNKIDNLMNIGEFKIGIGHLRSATSGASAIPNPHPWIFSGDSSFTLVHNGNVSKEIMKSILINSIVNSDWINDNPPQTFGLEDWDGEGWVNVVDSELILLLIMQQIEQSGNVLNGFKNAIRSMLNNNIYPHQINLVFSDGVNLYGYGGQSGLYVNNNFYFSSIMSSPPPISNEDWIPIQENQLVMLTPIGVEYISEFASVDESITIPEKTNLLPAFPNPFNNSVNIKFEIDNAYPSKIKIYNILGSLVFSKVLNQIDINKGHIKWEQMSNNGGTTSSGTYYINLISGDKIKKQKILLIK